MKNKATIREDPNTTDNVRKDPNNPKIPAESIAQANPAKIFNKADIIDKQKIEAKIREGKDIFNRKKELKLIQIDDTFPKYIKDNLSKFREWIN